MWRMLEYFKRCRFYRDLQKSTPVPWGCHTRRLDYNLSPKVSFGILVNKTTWISLAFKIVKNSIILFFFSCHPLIQKNTWSCMLPYKLQLFYILKP